MTTNTNRDQRANYFRVIQWLTLAISLVFISVIAYGYYHLFASAGAILAFVIALVLALAAWLCAKVIGAAPESSKAMVAAVYVPLLVISATGVFSSMMLYIEGSNVVSDAANSAEDRFDQLSGTAESALISSGAARHINKVQLLKQALISEIKNPLNCGQGPVARNLIAELQRELPGFTPLSNPSRDCGKNEDLIADYNQKIDAIAERAPWNNADLVQVVKGSAAARIPLDELRTEATTNYSAGMIQKAINTLETQDTEYRSLRNRLSRSAGVRELPDGLDYEAVQSLGSALKLLTLLIKRIDQLSTWVYLFLAVGFDLFMVHMFRMGRQHHVSTGGPQEILAGAL